MHACASSSHNRSVLRQTTGKTGCLGIRRWKQRQDLTSRLRCKSGEDDDVVLTTTTTTVDKSQNLVEDTVQSIQNGAAVGTAEEVKALKIGVLNWNQTLPVAALWTRIFCDYYYGPVDESESISLGRRASEFIYFFTMFYSCLQAVANANSFCIVAEDTRDASVPPLGAIAGRILSRANADTVLGLEDWKALATEEFELEEESWEDLELLYLWNFGVDSNHRKKGIATRVMEWVETPEKLPCGQNIRGVCLFVYRTNWPAIKLYEKLGYKVTSWKDPRWLRQAENNKIGVERKLLMIKHM